MNQKYILYTSVVNTLFWTTNIDDATICNPAHNAADNKPIHLNIFTPMFLLEEVSSVIYHCDIIYF